MVHKNVKFLKDHRGDRNVLMCNVKIVHANAKNGVLIAEKNLGYECWLGFKIL